MKRPPVTAAVLIMIAVLAIVLWVAARAPSSPMLQSAGVSPRDTPSAVAAMPAPTPAALRSPAIPAGVVLPNRLLTPGVASADVTPANVFTTICVSGYTSGRRLDDGRTVRPSDSYTEALKRKQIAQYAYADKRLSDYEEDHLIPLELGGDGYAPGNLWPEPYAGAAGARLKDQLENVLHRDVCAGTLGLRAAQQAIATNWYVAWQTYG